ncbi:MAG: SCO family protein, partial [Thermodesulfobacteriota bacterium]
ERLSSKADIDTEFSDSKGKLTKLSSYFEEEKPVIINLAYFTCPRVCTFGTDGLLEAINELEALDLGKDYKVLTISFNDKETPSIAKEKSKRYIDSLRNGLSGRNNWEFLTGDEENIVKLTNSLGFKFKEDKGEFAHPSGIMILTPDGTISRYLYGIQYNKKDLRLALIEASESKIGKSQLFNSVLLFCYKFDPVGKRYALQALNIVKAGGFVTFTLLVGFLMIMWKKNKG